MKTCPRCSTDNFWPTSYMHDSSRTVWRYSFCTECGYQSEAHSPQKAFDSTIAGAAP